MPSARCRSRATKKDAESQRIATTKIEWAKGKLADLRRSELEDRDSRIFPGRYAPVLVMENGRRVVKPMRYQCRLPGKPAFYDTKFPGTYNAGATAWKASGKVCSAARTASCWPARSTRTWRGTAWKARALSEGEKPQNVVLEFKPRPAQDMLVACLWSRWSAPGEPELLSFAAITDEPPAEVAAAGHDRCIIPIRPRTWTPG